MRVSTLCETAALLGYKVMLVPSSSKAEGFEMASQSRHPANPPNTHPEKRDAEDNMLKTYFDRL